MSIDAVVVKTAIKQHKPSLFTKFSKLTAAFKAIIKQTVSFYQIVDKKIPIRYRYFFNQLNN